MKKKFMITSLAMVLGIMLMPVMAMASNVAIHNNTGSTIVGFAISDSGRNIWQDGTIGAPVISGTMASNVATPTMATRIAPGESFVINVPDGFDRYDLRVMYDDNSRHEYMNLKNSDLPNVRLNANEAVMY